MDFARLVLIGTLVLAAAPAAAGPARAPAAAATPEARAALVPERQRVRAELEGVNAEVDALRRSDRGVRDDYRLRARLADAEALARRLTEIDARLGEAPRPTAPAPAAEPRALPGDGPAE